MEQLQADRSTIDFQVYIFNFGLESDTIWAYLLKSEALPIKLGSIPLYCN